MTCPKFGTARHVGHPAGLLTYSHAAGCDLGRAQDATRHADAERTNVKPHLTRPVTDAEVALLSSLALPVPTEVIVTRVTVGGAVIHRHYGYEDGDPVGRVQQSVSHDDLPPVVLTSSPTTTTR